MFFILIQKKTIFKRKKFSHPLERTDFLPKENIYLFTPQKTNFSNEKVFHTRFKETFTWCNHMAHPKKKTLPKMFFILIQKNNFPNEKIFHTHLKEPIFYPKKTFICPPKKQFFKRKSFSRPFQRNVHLVQSHDPPKKRKFYPKNFLYLTKNFNFSNEKIFQTHLKELIFYQKKTFLILKLPLGALRQSRL